MPPFALPSPRIRPGAVRRRLPSPFWRWLEWLVLFVALPVALRLWWRPAVLLGALVAASVLGAWWLARQPLPYQPLWRGPALRPRAEQRQLRRLLRRFALWAGPLVLVV